MNQEPTALGSSLIRAIAETPATTRTEFVKLHHAVSRAARIRGCWSERLESCLNDEELEWSDQDRRFFDQCVQVIRPGTYIEGQGNYGGTYVDDEFPDLDQDALPAHPKFLECRLTKRGLEVSG